MKKRNGEDCGYTGGKPGDSLRSPAHGRLL